MSLAVSSVLEKISRVAIYAVIVLLFAWPCVASEKYMVLCYHDIPVKASDSMDVAQHIFVNHLEYLKSNGYTIINPDDIMAAQKGIKPLPEKAVLLTFDDAYISFYQFVYPILKLYGYSAVLSVVCSWIEKKPEYVGNKDLMSWKQIKEMAESGRVYIASHSNDSHKGLTYNPAGNTEPAMSTFAYSQEEKRYETDKEFRNRIKSDLEKSIYKIKEVTGTRPWILTWPYGEYNLLGVDEGQKLGFKIFLTLESKMSTVQDLSAVNRNIITKPMGYSEFAAKIKEKFKDEGNNRAVQIDLDMIVNPESFEESDHNLGIVIERLMALGVDTVILQAFCDRKGTGNISSVYFSNNALPVEMDFLSHAVNRIRIRGMKVYVWMPVLSYELPDKVLNESLKVKEFRDNQIKSTSSWYRRLSPFEEKNLTFVKSLYRDLAANVRFDGILFQDDAYLTDLEDFHPSALKVFKKRYGVELGQDNLKDDQIRQQWTQLKTDTIDTFIRQLMVTVKEYRPLVETARNIYSIVLLNPDAREWFCQDFESYLKQYDYTVIMAYPQMEGLQDFGAIKSWLAELISRVDKHHALDKVIFKVQSYDWKNNRPVNDAILTKELRFLVSSGGKNLAYYPDNVFQNQPKMECMSSIISTRTLPREWLPK
ncbi:MAG: poly-beta-1,6-N-acetyl-D-glucosamine N-deacetylase PgaB [Proteobacteria bacterium]|nr:poly-beta-1,6-N-acetyl-D-glucosamine N-deacetylase PgaB [Pseudomonadota bacterium]MBU4009496.1 poly-beta-1,6-N-acetyl-D-glucosamine N-deacetylase PgaB [Pseudomonadota bacterium]